MSTAGPAELRAVLDTNVYVSAFTRLTGTPFEIWCRAWGRQFVLLVSPGIVEELAGVLRSSFGWEEARITYSLKLLTRTATIVQPTVRFRVIGEDPADDKILDCAVAGNAGLIVSGDHDLRRLKSFRGIRVVSPADFKRILGL